MSSYTPIQEIGKGTYGTVYLCEKIHNKMKVVIKEMVVDTNSERLAVAQNEVAILKTLNHPNICKYYDSFKRGQTFTIVMEYARFGNLYEYLKGHRERNNLLSNDFALNIFCQILLGLNYLHTKKIIHRDMKTENIFITGAMKDFVKIGDFGISKSLKGDDQKANTVIGTTNYLAPEMCDGKPYDIKSDIWSLGCILYEICALERLFEGPISGIVMDIKAGRRKKINTKLYSADIQTVIDAIIQVEPNLRPTTEQLMTFPILVPRLYAVQVNMGNIFNTQQASEQGNCPLLQY